MSETLSFKDRVHDAVLEVLLYYPVLDSIDRLSEKPIEPILKYLECLDWEYIGDPDDSSELILDRILISEDLSTLREEFIKDHKDWIRAVKLAGLVALTRSPRDRKYFLLGKVLLAF